MSRETCVRCRAIPTDILVLECDHTLCIKCASRSCNIDASTLICPSCRSQTYLDEEIVNQICMHQLESQEEDLRRAGCLDRRKPSEPKEVWYKMSNKENDFTNSDDLTNFSKADSRFNMSRKNSMEKVKPAKKAKKQIKNENLCSEQQERTRFTSQIFCKVHKEYQIMYFCLQCESSLICPECVIHGEHKNHQVETIKKTITKIHAELSSKTYSLNCSIQGLVQASEQKKQQLKSKIDQINRLKVEAASKYKMIREEIAREQADVMSKCVNLISCFESDFSQMQKWIKSDLLAIEKERDSINYILNPFSHKKEGKPSRKEAQIKIVEQYLNYHKKNEKYQGNKFLWLNNKDSLEQIQPESEQSLTVLTDRIQRIKFVPSVSLGKTENFNQIATKNHSLAASRNLNAVRESKENFKNESRQAYYKYVESPFNNLKMSSDKQPNGFETESILTKGSQFKDSSKLRRKSLKSEQQANFLIF